VKLLLYMLLYQSTSRLHTTHRKETAVSYTVDKSKQVANAIGFLRTWKSATNQQAWVKSHKYQEALVVDTAVMNHLLTYYDVHHYYTKVLNPFNYYPVPKQWAHLKPCSTMRIQGDVGKRPVSTKVPTNVEMGAKLDVFLRRLIWIIGLNYGNDA